MEVDRESFLNSMNLQPSPSLKLQKQYRVMKDSGGSLVTLTYL